MALQTYYYNEQIKKYLVQFQNIFAGLQVQVGKTDTRDEALIPVPVHYGSKDRFTAAMLAGFTQNKPIRLPLLSAHLTNVELGPDLRKGIGNTRSQTYLPSGGLMPDDLKVVRQYMPVPYWMNVELAIYASNSDQQFQILEQIFMLFDPILQIQTSDGMFDWTKITTVEMVGIRTEENYPSGTDRRMMVSTLDFRMPIYIAAPSDIKETYVHDIKMRLAVLDASDPMPQSADEFDELAIDYEKLVSSDDLILP